MAEPTKPVVARYDAIILGSGQAGNPLASAEVAYMARRALEYGIKVGNVSVDMPAVRERKRGMVKKWRDGSEKRLREADLVDLIYGEGSFVGPKQVRVR